MKSLQNVLDHGVCFFSCFASIDSAVHMSVVYRLKCFMSLR